METAWAVVILVAAVVALYGHVFLRWGQPKVERVKRTPPPWPQDTPPEPPPAHADLHAERMREWDRDMDKLIQEYGEGPPFRDIFTVNSKGEAWLI